VTSLHATSAGKAILGSLDDKALKAALAKIKFEAFTPSTLQSKTELMAQIRQGQKAGYYINRGESLNGLTTLAAPFSWQQALYVVSIAGPGSRLDGKLEEMSVKLLEVCRKLEMKGRA
jgi:DNA-binding IclR family transcriptional regulator